MLAPLLNIGFDSSFFTAVSDQLWALTIADGSGTISLDISSDISCFGFFKIGSSKSSVFIGGLACNLFLKIIIEVWEYLVRWVYVSSPVPIKNQQ